MKTVKCIFAILGLVWVLNACAPDNEDVIPENSPQNLERFDVKSTDGNDDPDKPEPGPR